MIAYFFEIIEAWTKWLTSGDDISKFINLRGLEIVTSFIIHVITQIS